MRFAHLKRILRLGRLRLHGPRARPGRVHFGRLAQAPRVACRTPTTPSGHVRGVKLELRKECQHQRDKAVAANERLRAQSLAADFCNKIDSKRTLSNISRFDGLEAFRRHPVASHGPRLPAS
jgi:hypothetical protein